MNLVVQLIGGAEATLLRSGEVKCGGLSWGWVRLGGRGVGAGRAGWSYKGEY